MKQLAGDIQHTARGASPAAPDGKTGNRSSNGRTPPRIAFIDLDDTLLGPDKTISTENLAALARLRSANVQIAVASGRHHRNILSLEALGHSGWILSSHGSIVRHAPTEQTLVEQTLDPSVVAELCHRGREAGVSLIAYHHEGAFIERSSQWTELYAANAGWQPALESFDRLTTSGFQKILWSEHPKRLRELERDMKPLFRSRLQVMETNPELLEFFSLQANKARGAEMLTQKLGIKPEEALAFGDGNNDVELLAWAGFSVAMHHGRESARRAADRISPPGDPATAFARAVEVALKVHQRTPWRSHAST